MHITAPDGTRLYVEEHGRGVPILFAHEFGGDFRSWKAQVDTFSSQYRCIVYSARGFLPSDIPADRGAYGQETSTQDIVAIADALELDRFHLIGLSMGSFTSLMVAAHHGRRLLSLTLTGCSSGPCTAEERREYRHYIEGEIALLKKGREAEAVSWFVRDSAYRRMSEKQPERWKIYCANLHGQSVQGALNTLATVHLERRCVRDFRASLDALDIPVLLAYGAEDHPYVRPTNAYLGSILRHAKTVEFPATGHLVNIEEPDRFNAALADLIGTAGT
jgi:pimeloyl-ACP methyl ester carboxylesterase